LNFSEINRFSERTLYSGVSYYGLEATQGLQYKDNIWTRNIFHEYAFFLGNFCSARFGHYQWGFPI